jgi:hypothetical protein
MEPHFLGSDSFEREWPWKGNKRKRSGECGYILWRRGRGRGRAGSGMLTPMCLVLLVWTQEECLPQLESGRRRCWSFCFNIWDARRPGLPRGSEDSYHVENITWCSLSFSMLEYITGSVIPLPLDYAPWGDKLFTRIVSLWGISLAYVPYFEKEMEVGLCDPYPVCVSVNPPLLTFECLNQSCISWHLSSSRQRTS